MQPLQLALVVLLATGTSCRSVETDADDPGKNDHDLDPVTGCSILPQAGCPEMQGDTLACDIDRNSEDPAGTLCRRVEVLGREGDSCELLNDCGWGLGCHDNICMRYCLGDEDCTAGTTCAIRLQAFVGGVPPWKLCTHDCSPTNGRFDPFTNPGCRFGATCRAWMDPRDLAMRGRCGAAGPGEQGDACDKDIDCAEDHLCRDGECQRQCRMFRHSLPNTNDCRGGEDCDPWGPSPDSGWVIDGIEYGSCKSRL
jgi:hypothetical protein